MKRIVEMRKALTVLSVLGCVLACTTPAACALPPIDLTQRTPDAGEYYSPSSSPVLIGGADYQRFYENGNFKFPGSSTTGPRPTGNPSSVGWWVPEGYASFHGYVGVPDGESCPQPITISILVDGKAVRSVKAKRGQKAQEVSVAVKGGQMLTFNIAEPGVVAEPMLLVTPASEGGTGTTASTSEAVAVSPDSAPAPFAVDPRDLDSLAAKLREVSDANEAAKKRLQAAQVAVATFMLIDIASKSIAKNVAEDLYTAMTNKGFQLVERGQLDKILAELKIQDTALISPQTAKKIGEMRGGDVVLVGSISDRGDFVVINARFLDTATGKSIAAERVEMRKIPIKRD